MSLSEVQSGHALRRVRSVGDLPRRPERAHVHLSLRASNNASDIHDVSPHDSGEAPRIRPMSSQSAPILLTTSSSLPTLQLDTNVNPSLPTSPTQINIPSNQDPQGRPPRPYNARKSLKIMYRKVCCGFAQFVATITILILSGTHLRSRSDPKLSEWTACEHPLGIWGSIWLVRVVLASSIAYWRFRRGRALHSPPAQTEAGALNPTGGASATQPESPALRHNLLFARLRIFSSLMTLGLVITAHVLEYITAKTCRHSSPHLWWLVFGIICTMYLMAFEDAVPGFTFGLVFGPIFLIYIIFVTIILICLGRYPWRRVNPEIGKLSKTVVETIPLVVYIPPPPEGAAFTTPHSYPPKTTSIANRPQPRFKFLRSFRNKKDSASDVASDEKNETIGAEGPISWEAHWEPAEYPFVALEGNRAACAICLMDFEAPKRKEISEGSSIPNETEHRTVSNMTSNNIPSGEVVQKELELEDAGDGVQPLRLLACGHVFHKTCLDPWLTAVSGRCPLCQQAVKVSKKKKPGRTS